MSNNTYSCTIARSSHELTAREKVMYKDTTNACPIEEATREGALVIKPARYVVLNVHNEKAKDNQDYQVYLVIDESGTKFVTGSTSFFNQFVDIFDEMIEAGETDFEISIYQAPSKNYKDKKFITCSLI